MEQTRCHERRQVVHHKVVSDDSCKHKAKKVVNCEGQTELKTVGVGGQMGRLKSSSLKGLLSIEDVTMTTTRTRATMMMPMVMMVMVMMMMMMVMMVMMMKKYSLSLSIAC